VRSIIELANPKNGPLSMNNPLMKILSSLSEDQKKKLQMCLMTIDKNSAPETNISLLKEIASNLGITSGLPVPTSASHSMVTSQGYSGITQSSVPMSTSMPMSRPPPPPMGYPSMSPLYYPAGRILPASYMYQSILQPNIHVTQGTMISGQGGMGQMMVQPPGYPLNYRSPPAPPSGPIPTSLPTSLPSGYTYPTTSTPISQPLNNNILSNPIPQPPISTVRPQTNTPSEPIPRLEVSSTTHISPSYSKQINNQPELPQVKPEESKKEIVIADELEHVWSGFITRNKQNRVGVDAYAVSGDVSEFFTDYNLNISHRTSLEELTKIGPAVLGMVAFTSQNETQNSNFASYVDYFNKKERAGIIYIKPHILIYLVSPCSYTEKYINAKDSHMLGILVNTNKLPKSTMEEPAQINAAEPKQAILPQSGNKISTTPIIEKQESKEENKNQQELVNTIMNNPKLLAMLSDPKIQSAIGKK